MTATLVAALDAVRRDPRNDEAWQTIYSAYRRQVLGHLYLLGVHLAEDREDLASEVFFRFVSYSSWSRDWSTLPDAPVIAAYLRKITQNVAYDAARSRARTDATPRLDTLLVEVDAHRGVEALTYDERQFLRRYIECGYSLTSLAECLGMTYSAAGTRLHRIRKKIRQAARGL
jgi:DNA-directed RNA polymerase specialized sigma24 family protein